jgi:hypothetical protein
MSLKKLLRNKSIKDPAFNIAISATVKELRPAADKQATRVAAG